MNYMRATNFMMLGGLMLGVCVEHSGDKMFPFKTVKYEKKLLNMKKTIYLLFESAKSSEIV
jgi:hypothetical protein